MVVRGSVRAGVAEWQTRSTQNALSERACGFESHHRYESRGPSRQGRPPRFVAMVVCSKPDRGRAPSGPRLPRRAAASGVAGGTSPTTGTNRGGRPGRGCPRIHSGLGRPARSHAPDVDLVESYEDGDQSDGCCDHEFRIRRHRQGTADTSRCRGGPRCFRATVGDAGRRRVRASARAVRDGALPRWRSPARMRSPPRRAGSSGYAPKYWFPRALLLSASYSPWLMVPASSSAFACSMSCAGVDDAEGL